MYNDEEELNKGLPRILHIAIVNPLPPKVDLPKKILEKTSYEYKDRLKFILATNIKNLYKQKDFSLDQKSSKGLINTKWFEDITQINPCLIILYYHIDEKANLDSEQQKIYNLLEEIKKQDNNISIFLFIIFKDNPENPYPFESEDKSNKYNLRNIINKEFIFVFPDEEIWKYFEFPNFCSNVVFFSRQYYMKIKSKLKEKKVKSNRPEEKIEYDIMLGILSTIKSKKIEPQESKYFEEAYTLLCDKNFDVRNYYYGNKSPPNYRLNFWEIRSVADWIFFKTFKLAKRNIKNQNKQRARGNSVMTQITESETDHRIVAFMKHIKKFVSKDPFDCKKEDVFAFMEYYWLFNRYNKLGQYIKENIKELSTNKDKVLMMGIVHLEKIYNLIRMIKYYRKFLIKKDLTVFKHKDKEIPISRIQNKNDLFYGKVPIFVIKDSKNPLFKEELPFDEDIFIKKFIYDKKLTLDNMVNDLNNKYIPETSDFFQKFNPNDLRNEKNEIINNAYGINLYLNILINLSCLENTKDDNKIFELPNIIKNMEQINDIIHKFEYIKKFPKLYINFLNKYNQSLLYQMNKGKKFDDYQKTQLFINLSILGYHRKLDEKEEELFFNLLNDEQFNPSNINNDKQILINLDYNTKEPHFNKNNNSLVFDYVIKDIDKSQERKILDLIEYDFIFKANFKEKIKFNSMKIIFRSINDIITVQNKKNIQSKRIELIEKEFSKEELENYNLDNNSPANLSCKLFMKNKMNKLQVDKIIFSLSKKENIIYQINIKNDLSKIIFLNRLNKNILNIKYPLKKYIAGNNQLFKFDFELTKEILDDIKISNFTINLEYQPSYYTKEVKNPVKNNNINSAKSQFNPSAIPNLQAFPSLSAFGQQLLGQQFSNNLNNINNIANFSMPYLLQNNINNLPPQNNNINPTIQNNLKIPNSDDSSGRTGSFTFNTFNNLLFPNVLALGPSLSMPNFPTQNPGLSLPSPVTPNTQILPTPAQPQTIQVELPPPKFYIYNEETKSIEKTEKILEKKYDDFESLLENKKNNFSILIQFTHEGKYLIKFVVTYSLKRKDIHDYYELSQENYLNFEVIESFYYAHEINSSNFLTIPQESSDKKNKKITAYLINENINMKLILRNKLLENINIKNIEIELDKDKLKNENKNIKINSNLLDVMNLKELDQSIKDDILTILSTATYCIPFETKFYNEFKGKIGKIKIKWTTPSLREFEKGIGNVEPLINENIFDFPYIIINKLELNYNYETQLNEKNEIILNIKVENNTKKCKKIIFFLETGDELNFIISGKIKQSKNIKSKETIKFIYKLIPLQNGELKLPSLKIWEINTNNVQDRLCSHFYFPQKIAII